MVLLAAAAAFAVLNWYAVARHDKRLEYIAKPATTALLLLAAATIDTSQPDVRTLAVIALAFCLAGDVFLMLPRDMFVPGLASFLIAHLVFMASFFAHDPRHSTLGTGIVAALAFPFLAAPIVRAVRRDEPALLGPVIVYAAVITAMFGVSGVTGNAVAIAGAAVFVISDKILATNKFVRPLPQGHLATMVTYHAALALLVLSLR